MLDSEPLSLPTAPCIVSTSKAVLPQHIIPLSLSASGPRARFCRLPFQLHTIGGANRELHQRYQIERPTVVLLRPDGYIAYRGPAHDCDTLTRYLDPRTTGVE